MKTWIEFAKGIEVWDKASTSDITENIGASPTEFAQEIKESFDGCKIFSLNDDIKELLVKTDGLKEIDNLPFDKIFIDVFFDVTEFNEVSHGHQIKKILGFLIVKSRKFSVQYQGKVISKQLEGKMEGIKIYTMNYDDTGGGFLTFNIVNLSDIFGELKVENPRIRKFAINFVSNFLNLINNREEVDFVENIYSPAKNKRRQREGKSLVPNSIVIIPVGSLKVYINQIKSLKDFSFSHRFWVRGFWRHYRSEKWKDKKGTKIWIKPFIKGTGLLIEKSYNIKLKEEDK